MVPFFSEYINSDERYCVLHKDRGVSQVGALNVCLKIACEM